MENILIAGGSGMIGSKLIKKLKQKNKNIVLLSTKKNHKSLKDSYYWNPNEGVFPQLSLNSIDTCFNFCGNGIFDQNFSTERKKSLLDSRVKPLEFLKSQFKSQNSVCKSFISVSATGIYPNISETLHTENSPHGYWFLSELVEKWESAAAEMKPYSEHHCIFRVGIVFSENGGFLKKMADPMKFYAGAIPGSGRQMVPWIHIDDLCDMLIFAAEKQLDGVYNAAAPHQESLGNIAKQLAHELKRPAMMPHLPPFLLRILFGKERHQLLLSDQKVSPELIISKGFQFTYESSDQAISQLFKS